MPFRFPSAVIGIVATAAAATTAIAQSKPNFSGTYALVVDKSNFGPMPGPTSRTDVIDHQEPKLVVKRTIGGAEGEQSVTLTMAIDGKSYTNPTPQGDFVSVLAWDGDVLVITTSVETGGGTATIVDRMSLSADKKTLTQNRSISVAGQEIAQVMVLERK